MAKFIMVEYTSLKGDRVIKTIPMDSYALIAIDPAYKVLCITKNPSSGDN